MPPSEKIKKFIKSFEGLRLSAYKLPGETYFTIGYGHSGPDVKQSDVWTANKANAVFEADVMAHYNGIYSYIRHLTTYQQDALTSFAFNIGVNAFKKSSIAKCIIDNRIKDIPSRMRLWVNDSTGKPLKGLVRRREAECKIFNNIYQNESTK